MSEWNVIFTLDGIWKNYGINDKVWTNSNMDNNRTLVPPSPFALHIKRMLGTLDEGSSRDHDGQACISRGRRPWASVNAWVSLTTALSTS